jgi:hypothetical protein
LRLQGQIAAQGSSPQRVAKNRKKPQKKDPDLGALLPSFPPFLRLLRLFAATSLPLRSMFKVPRSMFEVRISIFTLLPHLAPLAESATVTDSPLQFSFHDLQPDLIKVSPLQAVEGPAGLAIEKAFFQHVGDYPLVYSPALARTSARVFADT